jgi:hypothetical protein
MKKRARSADVVNISCDKKPKSGHSQSGQDLLNRFVKKGAPDIQDLVENNLEPWERSDVGSDEAEWKDPSDDHDESTPDVPTVTTAAKSIASVRQPRRKQQLRLASLLKPPKS